ncbi:superoxide dismutase [Ni] [Draconibacterium sp. IB214405]|uniref:superoxide dismutase [Ni] n=1 Tax=Draconibacterium sp. IB214405 TaxID=3097352 RepID=UPI002A161A43|nr:superoxide dismutase [Ni] [Draconibacterium sp. IB214405]MDX8338762.1 superoxide dismutase [Ni] [Draconibacterium sp. IB214405]
MKKITQLFSVAFIIGIITLSNFQAKAHCEIPCGIYGDSVRIALLYEHIETIEKSMNQINELSKSENPDYNQLVRWVMNKEEHAKEMQEIVSQYFLHQRVKITSSADEAAYRKYVKQLELLHHLSVFAMKSKQSTDLSIIDTLREKLHLFEHAYFGDDH